MKKTIKMLFTAMVAAGFAVAVAPNIFADSPGDTIGFTEYDCQALGSTGSRVAVDSAGGVHFTWLKGINHNSLRYVAYNYRSRSGHWLGGEDVSRGGYPQVALMPDCRAAVFCQISPALPDSLFACAIDMAPGRGFFNLRHVPSTLGIIGFLWPSMAIDRNGRIHVVATGLGDIEAEAFIGYTRTTDEGLTWTNYHIFDSTNVISAIVTASRVSDQVAIIYTRPEDITNSLMNDVFYIVSNDGITWDWDNGKVNLTQYGRLGDSLYAYTDVDAVFDYNDDLHIIWNAQYISGENPIPQNSCLLHFDVTSGRINQICVWQYDLWPAGCDFGTWNSTFSKMSIACDTSSNIYVTYTSWDSSDCSASGYANGDIHLRISTDCGAAWSGTFNLTNSHTPFCAAGDCDSDHWSSLAEVVDEHLHLFYVNDKDAGGILHGEGAFTNNPMLYLEMPLYQLGLDMPSQMPTEFSLHQNYPNPFNAATTISFELNQPGHVRLDIFDVTGARVAAPLNENKAAGRYDLTWDAAKLASGTYFVRLEREGKAKSLKMTLLK